MRWVWCEYWQFILNTRECEAFICQTPGGDAEYIQGLCVLQGSRRGSLNHSDFPSYRDRDQTFWKQDEQAHIPFRRSRGAFLCSLPSVKTITLLSLAPILATFLGEVTKTYLDRGSLRESLLWLRAPEHLPSLRRRHGGRRWRQPVESRLQ